MKRLPLALHCLEVDTEAFHAVEQQTEFFVECEQCRLFAPRDRGDEEDDGE